MIGNNVTAVTVNSNLIAGNVTVDNNLIVNTDDFVVDTVNSKVGINKASPTKDLDVTGEIECSSHLTVGGDISGNGDAVFRKYTIASPGSGQYSVIGPGFSTATVNPTLTLMRGQKYVFDNTVHNGHPLEIRDGNGGSAYTSGVSGADTATITFTVPMDAPLKLYYQCTQHLPMGNIIYIPLDSIDTTMALNLSNNLVVTGTSNVGIGTSTPAYTLDVHGTANVGALTATSVSGDGSGLTNLNASNISSGTLTRPVDTTTVTIDDYLIHDGDTNTKVGFPANDTFTVTTANSERLRVDSSGNVGIGTSSPGYKLHVSGDIYATGNVTAYSDVRKKKNLEIIERPIEKIEKLNGYTYEIDDKRYTGLVAQEVLKVLPEAVVGSEEKGYGLAYGNMAGLFVEAMKELKSENHSLKVELASVLARLDALENP